MARLAIGLDLGTSGFRAQAIDLSSGQVLSTAITTRHPLPGGNVIDHVHFALALGVGAARDLVVEAVNRVLGQLRISLSDVVRLAVCGNPAQLSLLQAMEIRDLAFAGSRLLKALDVRPPQRAAAIRRADEFPGLILPDKCQVIIPPAVRHEIGADALALIIQTGMLECVETTIAIDYGTNAEMALAHEGKIFTGSAAAGPALEGQHITCGSLAIPGAIADLEAEGTGHRLKILDDELQPVSGAMIDLAQAEEEAQAGGPSAVAITGTGTIAALDQALEAGLIALPHIRTADRQLHFGKAIYLTEGDLAEAGKAIGAIRAGYFTLSVEAGIAPADIRAAFLAGASGTYMDAKKAGRLGLIPAGVHTVRQVGNTSLAMARQLALAPAKLEAMSEIAERLQQTHSLFALSKTFARVFILELARWTEGMPMPTYREMLRRYRLPDLPPMVAPPQVTHTVTKDIGDPGRMGLVTINRIGKPVAVALGGWAGCATCASECPARALSVTTDFGRTTLLLDPSACLGVACRRCEQSCPSKVFHLEAFFGAARRSAAAVDVGS